MLLVTSCTAGLRQFSCFVVNADSIPVVDLGIVLVVNLGSNVSLVGPSVFCVGLAPRSEGLSHMATLLIFFLPRTRGAGCLQVALLIQGGFAEV